MVFCTKCGTENVQDAKFCQECGVKIEKLQSRPSQEKKKSVGLITSVAGRSGRIELYDYMVRIKG